MSGDLIVILIFVMPGLVGAGTYRLLTVNRKMDQFDFTVFSFVLTITTLIVAWVFEWFAKWSCNWNLKILPIEELVNAFAPKAINGEAPETNLQSQIYLILINYLFSVGFIIINVIGIGLGVLLSYGINSGKLFEFFKFMRLTRKTGRVDPWQDFFNKVSLNKATWVVITFKNRKKYYGLVKHFSDDPEFRQIVIAEVLELRYDKKNDQYVRYQITTETEEWIYVMVDQIAEIQILPVQPVSTNEERA